MHVDHFIYVSCTHRKEGAADERAMGVSPPGSTIALDLQVHLSPALLLRWILHYVHHTTLILPIIHLQNYSQNRVLDHQFILLYIQRTDTLLRRGGGSRPWTPSSERSQVAVSSASVDDGRGVLASLLSCFSLLERHLRYTTNHHNTDRSYILARTRYKLNKEEEEVYLRSSIFEYYKIMNRYGLKVNLQIRSLWIFR